MSANGLLQIALFLGVLITLTKPLGWYMAQVYEGKLPVFVRWIAPVENLFYRLCGVDSKQEMRWTRYAMAMLWFALLSMLAVYAMQRLQGMLPLNPQGFGAVSPDSSFNTAISFMTNTNWQGYGGESTMSYLTQMLALAVQNFLSRRCRHGRAGGTDTRLCTPHDRDHRQLLGGYNAQHDLYTAATFCRAGVGAGQPRGDTKFLPLSDGTHGGNDHLRQPESGCCR